MHDGSDTAHRRQPKPEAAAHCTRRDRSLIVIVENMPGIDAPDPGTVVDDPQPDCRGPVTAHRDQYARSPAVHDRIVQQITQRPLNQRRVEQKQAIGSGGGDTDPGEGSRGHILRGNPLQQRPHGKPRRMRLDRIRLEAEVSQHVRQQLIGGGKGAADAFGSAGARKVIDRPHRLVKE